MSNIHIPGVLDDLLTKHYGWLSPTGDVFPCKMYDHISVLKDIFTDQEISNEIIAAEEEIKELVNEQFEYMEANPDDHPEWHRVNMGEETIRMNTYIKVSQYAYANGWARIGIVPKKYIEFEGSREFKNSIFKHGSEVAEMLNLSYKFNLT